MAVSAICATAADGEALCEQRGYHARTSRARRLYVEAEDKLLAAGKAQQRRLQRKAAGVFEHARDPETAVFAAAQGVAPAALELLAIRQRESFAQDVRKIAAVDDRTYRGLVRHGGRLDPIAPAQRDRINSAHPRRLLHHTLEHVICLRPASATIRRSRRRAGEDAACRNIDAGNAVLSRQIACAICGLHAGPDCSD